MRPEVEWYSGEKKATGVRARARLGRAGDSTVIDDDSQLIADVRIILEGKSHSTGGKQSGVALR
jgi:hypothetical protein